MTHRECAKKDNHLETVELACRKRIAADAEIRSWARLSTRPALLDEFSPEGMPPFWASRFELAPAPATAVSSGSIPTARQTDRFALKRPANLENLAKLRELTFRTNRAPRFGNEIDDLHPRQAQSRFRRIGVWTDAKTAPPRSDHQCRPAVSPPCTTVRQKLFDNLLRNSLIAFEETVPADCCER